MVCDDVPDVQLHTIQDISCGQEPLPIPAIGLSVDDLETLARFETYVADSIFPTDPTPLEISPPHQTGEESDEEHEENDEIVCECEPGEDGWACKREDGDICDCVSSFGNFYSATDKGGSTSQLLNLDALPNNWPLVECSPACSCGDSCSNRLTQRGVRIPLTIRPVPRAGLGLFYTPSSPTELPRGSFISLYAGQYLSTSQARSRWKDQTEDAIPGEGNYILSLRLPDQAVHIDPRRVGNVGRFLNHSCDPNCVVQVVRWGARSQPRAAIFAKRHISVGEELTFDYGDASGAGGNMDDVGETLEAVIPGTSESEGRTRCFCGSARCRGWMPFDGTL